MFHEQFSRYFNNETAGNLGTYSDGAMVAGKQFDKNKKFEFVIGMGKARRSLCASGFHCSRLLSNYVFSYRLES